MAGTSPAMTGLGYLRFEFQTAKRKIVEFRHCERSEAIHEQRIEWIASSLRSSQ
jgi:hypothetical protein